MKFRRQHLAGIFVYAALLTAVSAQSRPALEQQAQEILTENCAGCHGQAHISGLDLRQQSTTLKGGNRRAAIIPGKSSQSLLYQAVLKTGDLKMPPGSKQLSPREVEILRQWIDTGARWPEGGPLVTNASTWWAFQPPKHAPAPDVKNASWVRTPIDAFILRKLEEKGLQPAPRADKLTLIRREFTDPVNPLAAKPPMFPAKAKNIIYLFMHGGPSHIDTFDPKPALLKLDGQKLPPSLQNIRLQFTDAADAPLLASRRKFQKFGQCGMEVSDLFPNVARFVDDIALIRSCHHEAFVHSMALSLMNTGSIRLGFPSMGSWIVYGLGSESQNLPAYMVMLDGGTKAGPPVYGSGFLPATYQGTVVRTKGDPFLNIKPVAGMSPAEQRDMLDNAKWFNEQHEAARQDDTNLSARIAAYELAFRMQSNAPELVDLSKETEATKKLYGADEDGTREFGSKCLLARRMVERGVRFVQLYSGGLLNGDDWDGHEQCDKNHQKMSLRVDKPIAGLLEDLKQRRMLESTLVIWGGDFGRTPITDGQLRDGGGYNAGRDHNPYGFSIWMASGGIKGGKIIGATDEIGFKATEDPVHINDIHAAILALLGLDHKRLTYFYQGRNFRLTDVGGDNDLAPRLLKG